MLWCTAAVSLGPAPVAPAVLTSPPLPLLPLLAPVVLSVTMAIVFRSPLALMMGVLGPLMVGGGWWESRRQARLRYASDCEEFERETLARGEAVAALQRSAVLEATRAHPSIEQWASHALWRGPRGSDPLVRVGHAVWNPPENHPLAQEGPISGMPAVVDSRAGLAFVGGEDARDLWRALLVQWRAHTTAGWTPRLEDLGENLPRDARGPSRIVWVATPAHVPGDCSVVVVHRSGRHAEVHTAEASPRLVVLDHLTQAQGIWALRRLAQEESSAPSSARVDTSRRDQLWMTLSEGGPAIDVVTEGPHAIVWGATGSGKSQTVVTLVKSLARAYTPQQLVCVVVDFKGGAGLRPLMDLPHTIGCVTDIGHTPSARALRGLRAEILRRERLLAECGVSECAMLGADVEFPRLLVVIDEVAWLLTNHPEWSEGLADVLARGRSLGVHVILSTQRVAGIISRAMMANISLRLCGRISDAGELAEWMPDAPVSLVTTMRHVRVGQVVIAGASQAATLVDVSPETAVVSDVEPSTWRMWVDELPPLSPWRPGEWALQECPDTQEHLPLQSPLDAGPILIVGDSGSGRTSAAKTLGSLAGTAVRAPSDPAGLWACLRAYGSSDTAIISDDCDVVVARAGAEGEGVILEAIQECTGPLLMVCGPSHRLTRQLSRLAPQTLVMSLSKPDDKNLWGATWRMTPGSALWRGKDSQILYPSPDIAPWRSTCTPSDSPVVFLSRDSTAAQWHEALAHHGHSDLVLRDLSHRDVRLESAGRLWIPALPTPEGFFWVWRGGEPLLANSADWPR